jgi:hypothetical protein
VSVDVIVGALIGHGQLFHIAGVSWSLSSQLPSARLARHAW